jgi:hypothetical protein
MCIDFVNTTSAFHATARRERSTLEKRVGAPEGQLQEASPQPSISTFRSVGNANTMSSHAPRTTNRRRSSSLNMDTRVTNSETRVARLAILAVDADPLQCKGAKLEHSPFVAQNNLADEQHARRGLCEELEEKDRKLSAAREGMSTLQERLIRRVGEIDAVINGRRQRTTHVAFSRPNSSVQTFAPSSSPELRDDGAPLNRIKTSETVRGAEYDALYEQYVELQKELEGRDAIFQAERAATRSESGLLKAELEVRSFLIQNNISPTYVVLTVPILRTPIPVGCLGGTMSNAITIRSSASSAS